MVVAAEINQLESSQMTPSWCFYHVVFQSNWLQSCWAFTASNIQRLQGPYPNEVLVGDEPPKITYTYTLITMYIYIYNYIYIYELRTKLFVWGNAITKCGGPPIGYQDFGCSGHQHKSRSMQFTLWDDVICYMIEKMQAWFCMESELQESKSRCTSSFWQQNTNNNW